MIDDIESALKASLQNLLFNGASPDDAINHATSALEAIIKQYWG